MPFVLGVLCSGGVLAVDTVFGWMPRGSSMPTSTVKQCVFAWWRYLGCQRGGKVSADRARSPLPRR